MRKDLNKQLCERERINSSRKYRHVRHNKKFSKFGEEGEMLPQRESIKYRYNYKGNNKEFNENLNPLYGAVRKVVGRRWDDFYSELCKAFNMRSAINQHILQHLEHYCKKNIKIGENGELYYRLDYSNCWFPLKGSIVEYYVDPTDSIIKRNKYRKSYKQVTKECHKQKEIENAKIFKQIDDDNVLHLIDGIWYHFTLKSVPKGKYIYLKPSKKDTFQCNHPNKIKTWDQLTIHEREIFGDRVFQGKQVRDLFSGELVFNDGKILKRYHASKRTASKKILKKGGIK